MGGGWGRGVFLFVWAMALCGVAMKLLLPLRFERLSVAIYLLLGWTILVAFNPLVAGASLPALVLLITGGGLYSLGVIFHLWERLPYQNAIRSEEHTSELQSLMRTSYAVFCLKKTNN